MKKAIFSFALLLTGMIAVAQSGDPYVDDVKHYLKINGMEAQYSNAIDQMFAMLKQQYDGRGVLAETWQELEAKKPEALEDINGMMVSAYRGYFSHTDIKNLIAFFESEAQQQRMADPSQLTSAQKEQLAAFFNSKTGEKLIASQESLTNMVGEISQVWSGTLYQNMTNALKERGYTPN